MSLINWTDFEKVQLCAGTITRVEPFPEARKPAYKVWIDLGSDLGIKKSSAQITDHYTPDSLLNKQVLCVVNLHEKQIGPLLSQVLITGLSDKDGNIVLISPDMKVPDGARLH